MFDHSQEATEGNLEILGGLSGEDGSGGRMSGCHGGGGGGAYVQWRTQEGHVFFPWWTATTPQSFWWSVFFLFLISIFYELFAYFRIWLEFSLLQKLNHSHSNSSLNHNEEQGPLGRSHSYDREAAISKISVYEYNVTTNRSPLRSHFISPPDRLKTPTWCTAAVVKVNLALLYGFQVFLAYFLMMIFMLFNGYFILAILAGFTLGKLLTLFLRHISGSYTYSTPCH
jgi:Ctr copper transporter family